MRKVAIVLSLALVLGGCGGGSTADGINSGNGGNTSSGSNTGSSGSSGGTGSGIGGGNNNTNGNSVCINDGSGQTPACVIATEANVTASEKTAIVDRHNYYRKLASATIPNLVWDDTLALHAQTWANYLANFYTNADADAGRAPHARLFQTAKHSEDDYNEGENIARSTAHIGFVAPTPIDPNVEYTHPATGSARDLYDVNGSVDAWASEAFYYQGNAVDSGNLHKVGHYTQIVWKTTRKVGCGRAISKVYTYFNNVETVYYEWVVCRYSPPGNYLGQKPY